MRCRKFRLAVLAMNLTFSCSLLVADEAHAGAVYAIDFGTATSPVEPGFTGVTKDGNAPTVPNTGTGVLGSITAKVISTDSSADESGGATTDLTRDYIYDDGNSQAVGVELLGLAVGEWKLEIWSWDNSDALGNQELEVQEGTGKPYTFHIDADDIGAMSANPGWETAPAVTRTFTNLDVTNQVRIYLLSRIAGDTNKTRLNAIRLTSLSEPVPGDQNDDGVVDLIDLDLAQRAGSDRATIAEIAENYGTAPPAQSAVAANVPEPSSFAILAIALLMFGKGSFFETNTAKNKTTEYVFCF